MFPFVWLSRINKDDLIDKLYTFIAMVSRLANSYVVRTQTDTCVGMRSVLLAG